MNLQLDDRVALVTGAAGGIGGACAAALAEEGCRVVISDVQEAGLQELTRERPDAYSAITADLLTDDGPVAIVDHAANTFGRLDIVIMAAGIFGSARGGLFPGPDGATTIPPADWDLTLSVNLRAAFLTAQAAMALMAKNGWGRLIAIASVAGQMGGLRAGADYAASKAGLAGMIRSLALTGGRLGITANTINPGLIKAPMMENVGAEASAAVADRTALGRNGTSEEVAAVAAMLASEQAGFITGAHIDVNGGIYLG
jgi:3-oxoacyl-[acyl-carrier protein] reductase